MGYNKENVPESWVAKKMAILITYAVFHNILLKRPVMKYHYTCCIGNKNILINIARFGVAYSEKITVI